jgi:peptidyl-prolyl cis-trans isomerase B (cyclophilin B)
MNKLIRMMGAALAMLLCVINPSQAQQRDPQALYAIIDTNYGVMEFLLRPDVAPLTVANFVNLAQRGYYDGLTFHRMEMNFMAQGGDPKGDGSGGPGYRFKDEIVLKLNQEGILAMANAGKDTNGSQFFITHQAVARLNGVHTVFGLIQSGKEHIRKIRVDDLINSITIIGDTKPLLASKAQEVAEWNKILDQNFPKLRPAQ